MANKKIIIIECDDCQVMANFAQSSGGKKDWFDYVYAPCEKHTFKPANKPSE